MSLDLRSLPASAVCVCGGRVWKILATFDDDGELATYTTDAHCVGCGAYANTPLPKEYV